MITAIAISAAGIALGLLGIGYEIWKKTRESEKTGEAQQ